VKGASYDAAHVRDSATDTSNINHTIDNQQYRYYAAFTGERDRLRFGSFQTW